MSTAVTDDAQNATVTVTSPRIISVKEHEPLSVSLAGLLDDSGRLRLNREIEEKGYFAAYLKNGRLRLQATGYVGHIPLNDQIVVNVTPRVPVANLSRMLRLSGEVPTGLTRTRGYATTESWNDSLLDIYASALIRHVESIASGGLLREYQRREEVSTFPRGRILMTESAVRLRPRGITHAVAVSYFHRTTDNPANRCLKYAIWFLAGRYARLRQRTGPARRLHQRLNVLYALFEGVELDHRLDFLRDPEVRGARPLPALRAYYRDALDLAVTIVRRHGVEIETHGESVSLPSLILNMNKVFEAYLRNVLGRYARENAWSPRVLDGNADGKKPLFDEEPSADATPDIVLRGPDGGHPAVIEVKNVPVEGPSKRESIEQAVTYGVSYRCQHVVLAHPRGVSGPDPGLRLLGRMAELRLYQYIFDLDADDLASEDDRFGEAIGTLINA